ncbi:hypothetical protein ACLBXM_09230 [Xanthobacteraceae bacterium A53D]
MSVAIAKVFQYAQVTGAQAGLRRLTVRGVMAVKSEHSGEGLVILQEDPSAPIPVAFQLLTTYRRSKEWLDGRIASDDPEALLRIFESSGAVLRLPNGKEIELSFERFHAGSTLEMQWLAPSS